MLFLEIISWKDTSGFNGFGGCFSDWEASILSGVHPMPPPHPTMGNPVMYTSAKFVEFFLAHLDAF